MIADPTMFAKRRKLGHTKPILASRILSARTSAWIRGMAERLRDGSQEALLNGDRNTAQVLLSEAELLELELGSPFRARTNAVALDDILFLQYGSQ